MTLERETTGTGTVAAVSRNDVYSFTKPKREEIVLVAGLGVEGDVHAGRHVRHRSRVRADPSQPNLRQVHLMQGELFEEVGAKGYRVGPGELGENVTTRGIDLLGLPVGTVLRFGPPPGGGGTTGRTGGVRTSGVRTSGVRTSGADAVAGVLAVAAATMLNEPTVAAAEAVAAAAARDVGDDPRPAVIVAGLRNPCLQINAFQAGLLKEVVGHDDQGALVRRAGVMAVVLRGGPIRPGDRITVEPPPPPHSPLAPI